MRSARKPERHRRCGRCSQWTPVSKLWLVRYTDFFGRQSVEVCEGCAKAWRSEVTQGSDEMMVRGLLS